MKSLNLKKHSTCLMLMQLESSTQKVFLHIKSRTESCLFSPRLRTNQSNPFPYHKRFEQFSRQYTWLRSFCGHHDRKCRSEGDKENSQEGVFFVRWREGRLRVNKEHQETGKRAEHRYLRKRITDNDRESRSRPGRFGIRRGILLNHVKMSAWSC